MERLVEMRRQARREFDDASEWYERQREGLGERFVGEVLKTLDHIQRLPESNATIHKDLRRALVRDFPFSVIYRVKEDRIVVLAIFHGKREPTNWRSRR